MSKAEATSSSQALKRERSHWRLDVLQNVTKPQNTPAWWIDSRNEGDIEAASLAVCQLASASIHARFASP